MNNTHVVSRSVIHFNGPHIDAQRLDLLIGQRDGFACRADEAGNAADVPHDIPGIIGQNHFDQNITGKDFAFHFPLLVVFNFHNGFCGDLYLKNQVAEPLVLYDLLYILCNFVLIPRVRVDDVPFWRFCHT